MHRIAKIRRRIDELVWKWTQLSSPPLTPFPDCYALAIREVKTPMGKLFRVIAHLPKVPTQPKIVSQELTVTVNGATLTPSIKPLLDSLSADLGLFHEGDSVQTSLVYTEDSGRTGRPRVESISIVDKFPATVPDEYTLEITERIFQDDPPADTPATQPATGAVSPNPSDVANATPTTTHPGSEASASPAPAGG